MEQSGEKEVDIDGGSGIIWERITVVQSEKCLREKCLTSNYLGGKFCQRNSNHSNVYPRLGYMEFSLVGGDINGGERNETSCKTSYD